MKIIKILLGLYLLNGITFAAQIPFIAKTPQTPRTLTQGFIDLEKAINEGNFTLARELIEKGVHVDQDTPPLNLIFPIEKNENLEKTADERIAFAKYLIDSGHNVNTENIVGVAALQSLVARATNYANSWVTKNSIEAIVIPLTELFMKAGVSLAQLKKVHALLTYRACITETCGGLCSIGCKSYGHYWKQNIEPIIHGKKPYIKEQ